MTPFERAIWEKANRDRKEAQAKLRNDTRDAQMRLDVERKAARDKYVSELRNQLDKLRQELRDAQNAKIKNDIRARIEEIERQKREAEKGGGSVAEAMIKAGHMRSAELKEAWRGHERGLAFCDRAGMSAMVESKMAAFDLGLSQSAGLIEPEMPPFLKTDGVGMWGTPGWYIIDSPHERWLGPFEAGDEPVDGTYYKAMSDVEFDAIWGAWLATIGPIDNILWSALELADFVTELVGNRGIDRQRWRPGRVDRNALLAAIASVHPEASVLWNEVYAAVPTFPSSITLTTYETTTRYAGGGEYFTIDLRRPENHDSSGTGFEVAQGLWDAWIDDLADSYSQLLEAREQLAASRPALERALESFRPFGLGSQYKFRGY